DINDDLIVVRNRIDGGDIFFFDRKTGKGLRKINRKGQGGEEYSLVNGIILDEANDEMFVNCASEKKIYVYDLYGKFKRSFNYTENTSYTDIFDYDVNHLIRHDGSSYTKDGEEAEKPYHAIISKQDGSITRDILIPFETIKSTLVREGEFTVVTSVRPMVRHGENWLLVEASSDTVYNYVTESNQLIPFIVRTPSIHAMNPEVFLMMGVITERYYFMKTLKKTYDFEKMTGYPTSDLMYDKEEKALFTPIVINADYTERKEVDMTSRPLNKAVTTYQVLEAAQLVEAYENGKLKGQLKDIAANLDAEDNPVILLVKPKR
ncbi:6-bladed beta-propeller, partial [Parabacteroides sp. OttesenSCG-928-G07]|nr:6-bladed beta-propeller [Parabacteroides sp. OttesenSCG-928-G07]